MREGLKLSSMAFLIGLMVLFQKSTMMKMDFIGIVLLAVVATYWCEWQIKDVRFRLGQHALLIGSIFACVTVLVPIQLANHSISSIGSALFYYDHWAMKGSGLAAFLLEIYDYAVNPDKTDFYHWAQLNFFFVLLLGELLYQIHRKNRSGYVFFAAMFIGGLLWFTYLEVWMIFSCFFIAYASERLTRNGKGVLFALVMPVLVTVGAVLMTNLTPVEMINDKLTPLTSESGWLRTTLNLSAGTGVFQLGEMGFYPLEDRLGGPVKLNKEIIFRIKSATPKLYLRGQVLTTYDQNRWSVAAVEPTAFYPFQGSFDKSIEFTLYDLKSKTNSVLVPMTVSEISLPAEQLEYLKDGAITYKGNLKYDYKEGFTVKGYELSYLAPTPKEEYLQLPENYSPKVVALTNQIIKGAKSDEDKIKRIRKYLINNYQYALAVAVPPEKEDFVEYFLTKEDNGYCVYFASATAVMSRIAGVPSRYVEGFVTPEAIDVEAGRDAAVSGERAHAWAEVYYDKKWQIIESTPTFTSRTEFDNEDAPLKSDLLEPEKTDSADKEETDMAVDLPKEEAKTASGDWIVALVSTLLLLLLGLFAISFVRFKSYFKGSVKKRSEKYVELVLVGLCQHFDLRNPSNMSPRQIIRTCDHYAPNFNLMALVEIVEKSLYDSNDISDHELELLAQTYWNFFHSRFSWQMKVYWYVKIAGKGRIFNGNDG